ncbi:MAG: hypothetical protein R3Y09_04390 [Clostridia bacterium]
MYKLSEKKIELLALLQNYYVGAENYITSKEIEKRLQIQSRDVRKIVNSLRQAGEPIGSNIDGYFYAQNIEEVEQTISAMLGRIKKVIVATDGLVASQRKFRTEESK